MHGSDCDAMNWEGLAIKQLRIGLLIVLLAAAGVLLWIAAGRRESAREAASSAVSQQIVYTGECAVMEELAEQKAAGPGAEEAIQAAAAALQEIERSWSPDRPDSAASRIAADAGIRATVLDEEEYALLERGIALSAESGGLFDVTAAPAAALWADGEPSADQLGSALSLVGYEQAQLDPEARSILLPRPGAAVDLSGVLWGYAAGRLLEIYEDAGLQGARASFGGVQILYGELEEGVPLTAEIQDGEGKELGTITGSRTVAVTQNGPVLDPGTGMPAETDLVSVTVLAEDPVYADYLADVIYAAGTEGLPAHLTEAYGVVAEDEAGTLYVSDSLDGVFTPAE